LISSYILKPNSKDTTIIYNDNVPYFYKKEEKKEERNKINKDNDTSKVKNYYIHCQIEYRCIGKILITEPDNKEDRVGYEWVERYN